jgi:fructose transport system substrate-binding protein
MSRSSILTVCLVTTALLGAAGCTATKSGSDSGGDSSGPVKIGLVTKTDTNPYFVKLRESAKAHAATKNAEVIAVAGKFDGDNEGQVAAIENLVQQGVKGILITPSNSTGILGALKQAKDKGVLVIALDTETDPKEAVDATYATNNVTAGELQGKYIKATLGQTPPRLLLMDGTPGGTVDEQRHRGFLQGMGLKDGDPAIIGAAPTNGDQNKAQAAMENLLQRDAGVNAVYTLNEPAARGAVAALAAKGLAGKVAVGSIDGGCQGVADVKAGKYLATVMQFPKKMASTRLLPSAKTGRSRAGSRTPVRS